ncbi:hypothetical protein [Pararhizobium sp. IMCC21322]|uniref:hypothetical protein n=1 Tax=Pararhizobium sp. IMCC21322 TaxID=3067903 RepID=UPI0027420C75|nr:hypothetical protein [Pararhizobium sp. IMCC21322]
MAKIKKMGMLSMLGATAGLSIARMAESAAEGHSTALFYTIEVFEIRSYGP